MNRCINIFAIYLSAAIIIHGCRTPEKLSKKYYLAHKAELALINTSYSQLYSVQPFILNFTDGGFKRYSVEISTDSIRYVYNTSIMKLSVADSISRFGLDSNKVKKLGERMFRSKCICVAHHPFYYNDHEFAANWLFFKQVKSSMFKESRYHVLIYFKEILAENVRKEFIERQELVQLENNVFYTISNRFK